MRDVVVLHLMATSYTCVEKQAAEDDWIALTRKLLLRFLLNVFCICVVS